MGRRRRRNNQANKSLIGFVGYRLCIDLPLNTHAGPIY